METSYHIFPYILVYYILFSLFTLHWQKQNYYFTQLSFRVKQFSLDTIIEFH
nr:MAG TPA: hypothetical protein [Caudoviricetes sp.]DAO71240.1 MAG TPA: hypothetical protein [Caudoviricetes sp.]